MTLYRFQRIIKNDLSQLYKAERLFSFSLLLYSSTPESKPKFAVHTADHLPNKHQFSQETAFKVSSFTTHLKNPKNADSVLSFLTDCGLSKTQLEHVVGTMPHILLSKLECTLKPKIKIFQDFGLSPTETAHIISADPWILTNCSVNTIKRTFSLLHEVLGSYSDFSRVVKRGGWWFLKQNVEKTLLPNLESLKSYGISSSQIMTLFLHFPRSLLQKPECFKQCLRRVDEMGVSRQSKMFIYAVRTISSMTIESWERKMQLFRSVGFTEDEILSVFRRLPNVFAVSDKKIKEMTEVLLGSEMYDISLIVNHPEVFIFSIERRIKPRLQVLKILERKNLLIVKAKPAIFGMSDKKFIDRCVLPFSDRASELLWMVNEAKHQDLGGDRKNIS